MFNDLSSPAAYLKSRRTAKAKDMVAPGPSPEMLQQMLTIALRTPDHGKLAPWRFIIIDSEQRAAFAAMLHAAYRVDRPEPGKLEIEAIDRFAYQAPTLVVAIFSPADSRKIPLWEQQLSAGAATMNLMHAAHAHGYGACWLTGWAANDRAIASGLGLNPAETIAGYIFIGTPGGVMEERPRPDYDTRVLHWDIK